MDYKFKKYKYSFPLKAGEHIHMTRAVVGNTCAYGGHVKELIMALHGYKLLNQITIENTVGISVVPKTFGHLGLGLGTCK